MNILAIETSCDETASAVIADNARILSNVVVSQIDIHSAYGGVIPEIAARSHIEAILPVVHQSLDDAHLTINEIDAIAVTHTPGLVGSLLIGTLTARTLAVLHHIPLYPIHHLKSHIYANWLSGHQPEFPLLAMVLSGGHTQIIRMVAHNDFQIIGSTRDDAIGEVFDKVAKILGLPYPGGPAIAHSALSGNPQKYPLPIPQVPDLDFSFSGLKTAVLRAVQKELRVPITTPSHTLKDHLTPAQIADFSASFQATVVKITTLKLRQALSRFPDTKTILLAGGVSANQAIRSAITEEFSHRYQICFPDPEFCTDNASMVGASAYYAIQAGVQPTDPYQLDISPRSPIS